MKKIRLAFFLLAILLFLSSCSGAKCGDVQIGEMNWQSAQLIANVDKIILKNGYDCNATIVKGEMTSTFNSIIDKGLPHTVPEIWDNAIGDPFQKAVEENKLYVLNEEPISIPIEAWWIDPVTARKHPQLKTVQDVLARPDLFPYEGDTSKGAFNNCPVGWACRIISDNLFRAFKMSEKNWYAVNADSGDDLNSSIIKAIESGKPWFGYYWSPNAIIGKYNLVTLDFGVDYSGDENWYNCLTKENCANPVVSAWSKPDVKTIVSESFKESAPKEVIDYLEKRIFPIKIVNIFLLFMQEKQLSGDEAAYQFLSDYPHIWQKWVGEDVFEKINRSL